MAEIQYGILQHQTIKNFFEREINSRKLCLECIKEREERGLVDKDKKFGYYSNLLPGFSSPKISIPVDVLIIAEAHGGGREGDFRQQQNSLDYEVANIGDYYLVNPINKFHQMEMRKLFQQLDSIGKTWVFADLIRCYVSQKKKENLRAAIKFCQGYLKEEIGFLRPKVVICLGNKVAKNFFGIREKLEHGEKYEVKLNDKKITIIWSYFPSRNTADIWVANKGWDSVIAMLKNN